MRPRIDEDGGIRRLVLLAAVAVAAGGCALFYQPPEVRVVALRVASLGITSGTAELDLDVHNENSGDIEIRGFEYRLEVRGPDAATPEDGARDREWLVLGEGYHRTPTTLTSGEETRVTVEIPFEYEALGAAVRSFLQEGEVRYRLEGALGIDGRLGEYQVPLSTTGVLKP